MNVLRARGIDLRSVSRWVWVLLALAAVWFLVQLAIVSTISASSMYSAWQGIVPILFAAALMFSAPRERLVQVAAAAFAIPGLVSSFIGVGLLLTTGNIGNDWAYLGPRLLGLNDAFNGIAWLFPLVAIFLVAYYIGPIPRTRLGWLVLAGGVVLTILQGISALASIPPEFRTADSVIRSLAAQVLWLGYAYLAAVAIERRMPFIAVGALSHLISSIFGLVIFRVFEAQLNADPNGPVAQVLLVVFFGLGFIEWLALLVGFLREIPRSRADGLSAASQGALSVGR